MYRGTTPTYTFLMPENVDMTLARDVYVTFCKADGTLIFTKTGESLEISERAVDVYLTQAETLSFPNGQVQVQLNWLYNSGEITKRACSEIMLIMTKQNLINEVIE